MKNKWGTNDYSINDARIIVHTYRKIKLYSLMQNKFSSIKNVMGKCTKCVEDNIGEYLFDFRLETDFSYSKEKKW